MPETGRPAALRRCKSAPGRAPLMSKPRPLAAAAMPTEAGQCAASNASPAAVTSGPLVNSPLLGPLSAARSAYQA